ncbi:hypothetical protein HK104_005802 [Borealophlyctis nickersoniae]|nr:hypothetical protein HK104_005802 [Borealophlyctis nickersoniae]
MYQQQQQQLPLQQQQQQQPVPAPGAQVPAAATAFRSEPYPPPQRPPGAPTMSAEDRARAQALLTEDRMRGLVATMQSMREQGATEENNPEYAKILRILRYYTAMGKQQQQQSAAAGATQAPGQFAGTEGSFQQSGAAPGPSGPFTPQQLQALRWQIYVYKMIAANQPIPENLQQMVLDPEFLRQPPPTMGDKAQIGQKVVEAAYQQQLPEAQPAVAAPSQPDRVPEAPPAVGPILNPYALLRKKVGAAELQHRLIIPSATPTGIDPLSLLQERERRVSARIQYRIQELENLPANLSNDGLKMKALIELKSLRLLERQKALRTNIVQALSKATTLATAVDRGSYRRMKKQTLREARQTEKQERNQRVEREKRERQKHSEYLNSILTHGTELMSFHKQQKQRMMKLGSAVQRFHVNAAKEEEKRLQRISQERLQALKANDEEAYMKLIDQTKDTRITHLLQQTNQYLKSLTEALHDQKAAIAEMAQAEVEEVLEEELGPEAEEEKNIQDYYTSAHKIEEIVTEQPSILIGGQLKDYQLKGLQWMVSLYNNRLNGILADEMGLGKTIQTLSLITYLVEKKRQNGPFLVIVPLSTLTNWVLEFEKWAPAISKVVYKGGPQERKRLANEVRAGNFNALLTTYEYIIKDRPVLSKVKWVYMIIDEGHRMKNANSKLSTTLMQYYNTRYRLILTGTPLQNNLPELWALLNFILPKIFNSVKSFDEWFNSPFRDSGQERIELNEEEALLVIRRLHKVLRPFLLRRLKKDVEAELPDKVETVIKCPMSALQHRLYEQIRSKKTSFSGDGSTRKKALNNLVMQFRKVCNHPYVFEEVEQMMNPSKATDRNLFRVAGKFELLDRILPKFFRSGHRILMFFQMTQIMDIMEDYLRWRMYSYLRLDGHTKPEDRKSMLETFNRSENPPFIFLLSTRAGGLGLNLQTADTVVIFDSDWNPHQDLQAQDRAHRIGQTKEVRILRLITAKSVEETILARAQYKLDIDGKVIQAGKFDNKTTDKEREDLLRSLFGGEDEEEEKEIAQEGDMDDSELNEIIARSDEEVKLFEKMDEERRVQEEKEFRAGGGRGKPPPRLMQDDELPAIYLVDPNEPAAPEAHVEYGRGARQRREVHYDDGLNEDQWLEALEVGDVEGFIAKKRARKAKRDERRRKKMREGDDEEDEEEDEDEEEIEAAGALAKEAAKHKVELVEDRPADKSPVKKRGRPPKREREATEEVGDAEEEPVPVVETPQPKKRGRKPKAQVEGAQASPAPKGKRGRKKFGVDPDEPDTISPALRRALTHIFKEAYTAVVEAEVQEEGYTRRRSDLYLTLPNRTVYADYYKLIKSPIALDMIEHRMNHTYYKSLDAFVNDFHLMFANAMHYNQEDSLVYNDAVAMKAIFDAKIRELCPEGKPVVSDEGDMGASGEPGATRSKRKRSPVSDDEEDDESPSVSRSRRKSEFGEGDGGEEKRRKKSKRDRGDIPSQSSKYGKLPRIKLRASATESREDGFGDDGERSD